MQAKNIVNWVFVSCSLLLVVTIMQNSIKVMRAQKRIETAEKRVDNLEKQKQELLQGQVRRSSLEYLERQIREKLHLVKPGETLVVLPASLKEQSEERVYKYNIEETKVETVIPPWKEWVALFW